MAYPELLNNRPSFLNSGRGVAAAGPLFMLAVLAALGVCGIFFGQLIATAPVHVPFILAVAAAMFFITMLRPDIALALLIFAMLLSPEIIVASLPRRDVVVRIEDILILVMGLAWIARSAIRKGADIIPHTPVNGWIGIYCLCFIVATGQGIIGGGVNPVSALFYILKYLEYYIIFFIVAGLASSKNQYRLYLTAFFVTLMIVNIVTASQIGHVERLSAPFEGARGEPNTLGGYLVFMFCLAMGLFCHLRTRWARWMMGAVAAVTLVPLAYTLSRSSYMAFVPAYLALIFYCRSRQRGVLVLALIAAVVLGAWWLPENIKERIMYTFTARPQETIKTVEFLGLTLDPSASARWWDWIKAFEYWLKQPFFGYGVTGRSFLDSQYVNNLVETGAFGFVAFAMLIGTLHYHVYRAYRSSDDNLVRGIALGFLAGNIGMLVHALTANTFIIVRVMEPYWFLAGMILAAPRVSARALQASRDAFAEFGGAAARAGAPLEKASWRNVDQLLGGKRKRGHDAT